MEPKGLNKMHLLKQTKKYKGISYTYYSVAKSYRDNKGKSKKKILFRLGQLSKSQEKQIHQVLALEKNEDTFVATIEDLVFDDLWAYLDVVFLHHIWQEWGVANVFSPTDKDIPTSDITEILTIHRCLAPGSKKKAVEWFPETVLPSVIEVETHKFNVDRIYNELDLIEEQKPKLEKHLIKEVSRLDYEGMQILFYDLTTSFFEGDKCQMAHPGHTKSAGFKSKQIVLALVVNEHGYPLMWNILEGATTDVKTIEYLLKKCKTTLGHKNITIVFDRGMVSDANLTDIEEATLKYISALDKDQIPGIAKETLKKFKDLDVDNPEPKLHELGFTKFDNLLYYRDLGVIEHRRYVIGLNPELLSQERSLRLRLLDEVDSALEELNNSLKTALKSRKKEPTAKKVEKILHQKNARQFIEWELKPITVERTVTTKKRGEHKRQVSTFQLNWSRRPERIAEKQLLDGVCLFVSNHTDKIKEGNGAYAISDETIVSAYRNKNEVENAFREIKSFIDFRPVYLFTDEHVKAHYTICVLAYLLNITVRNGIRDSKKIENCHPRTLYSELEKCHLGQLGVKNVNESTKKLQTLDKTKKTILKEFGYEHIITKRYLNKILD